MGLRVVFAVMIACAWAALPSCRPPATPPPLPPPVPSPPQADRPLMLADVATSGGAYVCEWTDAAITIDGKADEEAWSRAKLIDSFTVPWVSRDKRPSKLTRARLLWDRDHLYFFADMDDDDLFADVKDYNGRVWENDAFELFFKPAADKPGYFEFEVSPANTKMELFIPQRKGDSYTPYKDKHSFKTQTAVRLRGTLNKHDDEDQGWSVEGRIRWVDLMVCGGRPEVNEEWKFSLCRVDYLEPKGEYEISTISPLTQGNFHRHEEFATVRFAPSTKPFGIAQRALWENKKLVGSPHGPLPYRVQPAFPKLKIPQPCFAIEEPTTGDLIVVQHLGNWAGPGNIVRIKNDPVAESMQKLLQVDELIYALCFHPKYAQNGWVYTAGNGPMSSEKKMNVISRWTMDRKTGVIDPKSRLRIIECESNGHNGAGIEFGPDGMLWFTTGDTSSDSDTANRGQDTTDIWSAVVRIDVDHPEPGKNYGIPKDNPFVGVTGIRPEIWAHGMRNPWRMSFDSKTGVLWVGQNGQDLWEQVYAIKKGANYGWPVYEGSRPFHPHRKLNPANPKVTPPTLEHHHSDARSLTGGIVYHGDKYPDLKGAYIYGDFSTGRVWATWYDAKADKVTMHKEIARTNVQITAFAADRKGELLICCDATGIHRLIPTPAEAFAAQPPFPRKLSQTGLFADTARHVPHPGLIPYDVNAPLWSDAAHKDRFLALPGDEAVGYTSSRGWNLPDGTAVVKTFSLDLEEGNPATRRRLETRIMLKQEANWAGYTYIWNDAQTDADLAPAEGVDQTLTVKEKSGSDRRQTWHYPSRAECLVCHSRAANWVLGLTELQMNRDFTYPSSGVTDNQLRTLEHLGVLATDYAEHVRRIFKGEGQPKKAEPAKDQRQPPDSTFLLKPPQKLPRLVDPADEKADLNARARSYLHANCAQCHVEAGGGNAAVDLEFTTDLTKTKLFDAIPQHSTFGIADGKLIVPGHPEKSVLYYRMAHRGSGTGQMPPLATNMVDPLAERLIAQWIRKMPPTTQPTAKAK